MISYRPATEDDMPAMQQALSLAFAFEDESGVGTWLRSAGLDLVRVLEVDGDVVGTALLAPMGQFFGSVSVPMTGVAAVTISPSMRGRGLAAELMRRCLQEIRESGAPLSVLYASTQALYRAVGYEQAGHLCTVRLPLNQIDVSRGAPMRPVADADRAAVVECYNRCTRFLDGCLDRGDYIWNRVYEPKGVPSRGFVLDGPGGIDAYVFFKQKDSLPDGRHNLHITDLQAATPDAARSLFAFLAGFSSMAHDAVFYAGPVLPLLSLLPEQHYTINRREYWMLRLVDVDAALTSRGYPSTMSAELHLDVTDDVMPDNAGPRVLTIDRGRASITRGGESRIKLDARALAAAYTGFIDPRSLQQLGRIKADDLDAMAAAFAGPAPAMADMF